MNNIYDLFNDRKSGIEAIYESNNEESVEEIVEEGFESVEEATEYMDEFISESTDEMIEFQAACYMENLVLEQMMYEDFNEEEMQLTIEGAMKERMNNAVTALQNMWQSIKNWFKNTIEAMINHFNSGKKIVEKYGKSVIIEAMKRCEAKVKINEYGDLKRATGTVMGLVNKLSSISIYASGNRDDIMKVVGTKDINEAAAKIRRLYITSDKPVVKMVREINAAQAVDCCETGGDFVSHLKEMRNMTDKSFDALIKQMKGAGEKGEAFVANAKFGATLRNKLINECIKCVNKITRDYRAIIIKALAKSGKGKKDNVEHVKGEVVNDNDREVKGALGDGRKPGQKALGQGNYMENWEIDEENEVLEEGIKDTIVTAKDKAKGKLNDMKEKHGDKKNEKAIAKKEKQIEKIRQNLARAKQYAQNQKEFADEFEAEAEADIQALVDQIDAIRAKLAEKKAVAEESFFYDDSEIEVLEEALKEKVGELKEKARNKIKELKQALADKKDARAIAKKEKDIEKIRKNLAKAKGYAQDQKEFADEFEGEANDDIQKLINEIDDLKARIAGRKEEPAQESSDFFDDIDFE